MLKRLSRLAVLLVVILGSYPLQAQAQTPAAATTPPSAAILCLPGVYPISPQDCLPLGPSAYRTQLASQGISFPLLPLPARSIAQSWGEVPYSYAVLGDGPTPVFSSLQEAISGKNPIRIIDAGRLKYISYVEYADTDVGRIFLLHDDTWVRVKSRVSVPHSFPGGITFTHTPQQGFGWILPFAPSVETRSSPAAVPGNTTGHLFNQYQLLTIYSTKSVEGVEWDLVGPDEWLEGRFIGMVTPNPNPPEGVTGDRWIEVNLQEQTLAVYEHAQLVYATLVATGLDPFFTRPGVFQIQRKLDSTTMSGTFAEDRSDFYYLEDVPWTMYYDKARALHGAYWRTAFGFPQSHGCINLAPADAHWLYDWASVGDWVYVWDPSGNTPTDPSYYGEGGA